ncbi:hypothetical protein [Fastidiosibacter lacustris]|uniref:hypothetical protein n=1 Tax=Fastidiosibacter lacustris TaxID=2056695 RepID=UPI000E3572A1|nr:hypothetical protein [Fastidiosibacter lacustris]
MTDNKLVLYFCTIFLAIALYIDLSSLYKDKKYEFFQQQATIDENLQYLQSGYVHLIDQLTEAIVQNKKQKNPSEEVILQTIRKYYATLEKISAEWVNIVWYDGNDSMFINQLGIANYRNKSKVNNLFSYCKPLIYLDNTINGRVCIEVSFNALENYLSALLSEDVLLFEDHYAVERHYDKKVFTIQFLNKTTWVLVPDKPIFSQFNIAKYVYFFIGSSIVVLIIRRHKRQLMRQHKKHQRVVKAFADEKGLYCQLLQYHHGANYCDFIDRYRIDSLVNAFDQEIRSLNLNVVTSIDEAVYQHQFNIFALQTLLLHFIGEAISNIQKKGEISIKLDVENDNYIHCVYSDNCYVFAEENRFSGKEVTQSDYFHYFKLTNQQIICFIEKHYIEIVTEVSKYQGKQILIKLPLNQTTKEYNVVAMFDKEEL